MRPPPLLLLQLLNALMAFGTMLTMSLGIAEWNRAGWTALTVGLSLALCQFGYATLVGPSGRCADRFGRARTALVGGVIGAIGALFALAVATPWAALLALVAAVSGCAVFFPGNAGLFSDAEGAAGRDPLPLHVKLSRYNLGWGVGNLAGFAGGGLVGGLPREVGFLLALASFTFVLATLWRWRDLPPQPPAAMGDRADHPALPRLTFMGRTSLLIFCMLGFALIGMLENALGQGHAKDDLLDAQRVTTVCRTAYACGYVGMFVLLGAWSGWVLRPWRLWVLQLGALMAAVGILVLPHFGLLSAPALALCGLMTGVGYGSSYTASIYYSLRLPHGASRAAGLHETFIGTGNTIGPLLSGSFILFWTGGAAGTGNGSALQGLGIFLLILATGVLAFQAALIPGATRLGAK